MLSFILTIFILLGIVIYLQIKNVILFRNIKKEKEYEKQKQSFLANLVHDLKTPTNAQLSTLKMLNNGTFGSLNSEQHKMITLTHESCKYMSDLIGTIMETYNHDNGKVHLNKHHFDIVGLVNQICDELKGLYLKNGQQILFHKDLDKYNIYADELQIKRVIANLLSNAITYGYYNTNIFITLKINPNFIEIFVKNKSKQIPKKELKNVFERYKKTKYAKSNITGHGLGLYLSKSIIELHNGEIYAESLEDGTCIFGFKLPITNDNSQIFKTKIIKTIPFQLFR